ncbi:DNA polymerase II large subunit, partial [Candidatus Pacearchaeota archaeon RBG_13_36_9]
MNTEKYFKDLQDKVGVCYSVAQQARAQGLDPLSKVEVPLAMSMAEKAVKLIATLYPQVDDDRIVRRILELEKEYGKLDSTVYFKIAEEIAREKFCKFESLLQAIDAGIRVGFAYITLAVVSSPIEGFTELKLGKTKKGEDYFIAYFSGPIRSAGTTASCMVLMLIDYLRETFGFAKYDPSEEEVKRYITENMDYHERVSNLQYLPTEEEIVFLAKNMPIQIAGDPTEQKEVSNFKDLPRVDTNFIRGGMCLIFSEGLAQKAAKGFRLYNNAKKNGLKMTGWDFLQEYIEIHKKRETGKGNVVATYIKDIVAGRPVFGHPSASGGFRFRYGRSRVNGFSATSIHPSVMGITDSFLSTGTQLKLEKPTKGCVVTSCDSIDGPIVKLKDGSVRKPASFEEAKKIYNDCEEIIYLGDLLFPISDVVNRNSELLKPGYVEEWWELELKKAGYADKIEKKISFEKAVELSEKYKIPLHPQFIYFWSQIDYPLFLAFLDWFGHSMVREGKLLFPYNKTERERFAKGKRALELLGVEQEVATENVVLSEDDSKAILLNLGIQSGDLGAEVDSIAGKIKEGNVLEIIGSLCKYKIKDKAGDFVGARMGRPEKAKLRKLIGSPNGLFPVGQEGGRMRSLLEAYSFGSVKGDFPIYYCAKCQQETIYYICEGCGEQAEKLNFCPECQQKFIKEKCPQHGKGQSFSTRRIDVKHFFDSAVKRLGLERSEIPVMIKGVRGTSSSEHTPEHLAKGILRAKHRLCVNKDGTVRYDVTELPITHFKPKEVSVSVAKLKELGYTKDTDGKELESEEQILELMPHDILIPCCPDSKDEKADDVFINVAQFLDDLLVRFYKLKPFYNIKNREDLVGHLGVCMAPHNCAGVIARIVGFSKVQGLMASPYMHAAVRRDCDGDEVATMLLLDVLVNFSRKFLPAHRGGTQDAPLVLNSKINAGEVDDQILDFEVGEYPLELYELAEQRKHSSEVKVETVKSRLKTGGATFTNIKFTHDSSDFNLGVLNSSYKTIPTMQEKVEKQMKLVGKLRAVDTGDVARLVIDRHFIRDIKGNLRKFSQQVFRCVKCNEKFRRPPLVGKCTKCGGRIIFTISEGGIIKYLEPALSLATNFDVPPYVKQNLELTKKYIESIFGRETEKQSG